METGKSISVLIICIFSFIGDCRADITPADESYVAVLDEDLKIIWNFDYEADVFNVQWSFKNKTSSSPTPVMVKVLTSPAQLLITDFNIEHESNGNVTIKSVTPDNEGIYYCTVDYKAAKYPSVTGTATVNIGWSTTTSSTTTSTSSTTTTPKVNTSTTSAATNPSATTSKNTSVDTSIIIPACVVPFVTLLIFFFFCYLLRRRRNAKKENVKSYDNDINHSETL